MTEHIPVQCYLCTLPHFSGQMFVCVTGCLKMFAAFTALQYQHPQLHVIREE